MGPSVKASVRYEVRPTTGGFAVFDLQLGRWADVPALESESGAGTVADSLNLLERVERLRTGSKGASDAVAPQEAREPRPLRPAE
jgi:hypothetical protein